LNQPYYAYAVYAILAVSAFYLGGFILIRNYKNLQGDLNFNLRSGLIAGKFFAGSVWLIGHLILPILGSYYAWVLWPVFVIAPFFGISVYKVFKYKFFNIRIIAAELLMLAMWFFLFVKFLSETSVRERLVDGVLLMLIIAFGVFLVRSVLTEIRQKEQLEGLNAELKDLNENLEQKVTDQTVEIRRAYEVEKEARIELEELNKAKDQFILTTQHHLRTPLTIVKGYMQSLFDMSPEETIGESKDIIAKASNAANRLGNLINELLDVSEMNFKQSTLVKKPTDPRKVIEEAILDLKPEMDKKNIQATLNAPMGLSLNLDPIRFKEAITNIIDNAVKYGYQNGGIDIEVQQFAHPIERDKQILRVLTQDNGIGIPQEELSNLFMRYFERGEEARKVYATGRGIGLAVAKNIIQAHGGRIYAESDGKGKGARFVVEVPSN
ncbi:MAG: HAMP domain-containing histidine kinase, partial [Candidatus Colwellbacteria bacterium]|nr:HAMP domain-containing histidine kinase [Candidatus Colwellbacteria bacterium]